MLPTWSCQVIPYYVLYELSTHASPDLSLNWSFRLSKITSVSPSNSWQVLNWEAYEQINLAQFMNDALWDLPRNANNFCSSTSPFCFCQMQTWMISWGCFMLHRIILPLKHSFLLHYGWNLNLNQKGFLKICQYFLAYLIVPQFCIIWNQVAKSGLKAIINAIFKDTFLMPNFKDAIFKTPFWCQ